MRSRRGESGEDRGARGDRGTRIRCETGAEDVTLLGKVRASLRAYADYERFRLLGPERTPLVVYSEGPGDWPHLGPVVEQLLSSGAPCAYCTSDLRDPGLLLSGPRSAAFYVGAGTLRAVFFRELACRVLLTTLPDLDVFELKRSPRVGTYAYAFHSINSTHTVYRPRAFESFDALLCVGPHHVRELRREEELKGIPPRRLLEHGSVKLDGLATEYESLRRSALPLETPRLALVAPSWGETSIAEDRDLLDRVIRGIRDASWACRLRLHPMTVRRHPGLVGDLRVAYGEMLRSGLFDVETDMSDNSSLRRARVMVSDWSGAATEFAFALRRPVLFLDTPRKIHNPGWSAFGFPGLEDTIRHEIGLVLEPSEASSVGPVLRALEEDATGFSRRADDARRRWVFNVGSAAQVGAGHVLSLLEEAPARHRGGQGPRHRST